MPALERARQAFEQRAWADSYSLFEAADLEACLQPEDLDRLATAAYLIGRDAESESFRTRAHQGFLERNNHEAAARSATLIAFGLLQRGATAPASGWFGRAARILEDAQLDSVVRGYLLIASAIQHIVKGEPATGLDVFTQSTEIARRFGDRDLSALACHGRGRALIHMGKVSEGTALLDEAMVAVIADDVSPMLAGDIYCSVLESCQETFDLRRADQWTASLARWCATQPDLVRYRGECLLYRAELMQLRGRWSEAAQDAQNACELLMARPAAGAAFYRVGEIERLRGQFANAESAYSRANERGRRPQPGLALLRLAHGDVEAAAASIRGVLADTRAPSDRVRMLGPAVEILLAIDDRDSARAAATELSQIARDFDTPFLMAVSAKATGAILLTDDDVAGASSALRQASGIWRQLEMPYEEAQTCLLIAAVCERIGDRDGRRLELDNARRLFTHLNVDAPASGRRPARRTSQPFAALSEREVQVLRLVAAGKSNREVATELFISEKTVARHVSNIFDKLGVSSRAAATAWVYQHNLI